MSADPLDIVDVPILFVTRCDRLFVAIVISLRFWFCCDRHFVAIFISMSFFKFSAYFWKFILIKSNTFEFVLLIECLKITMKIRSFTILIWLIHFDAGHLVVLCMFFTKFIVKVEEVRNFVNPASEHQ